MFGGIQINQNVWVHFLREYATTCRARLLSHSAGRPTADFRLKTSVISYTRLKLITLEGKSWVTKLLTI